MPKIQLLSTSVPSFDELAGNTKITISKFMNSTFLDHDDFEEMFSLSQETYLRCLQLYHHKNPTEFKKLYFRSVINKCKSYITNKRIEWNERTFYAKLGMFTPQIPLDDVTQLRFYSDLSIEAKKVIDILFDPPKELCNILQHNKTNYSPLTVTIRFVGFLMGFSFPKVHEIRKEIRQAILDSI